MGRTIRIAVFSLSLLILGYVSFGYLFGQAKQDKPYQSLTVYGEVLDHVQEDYVDQPDLHLVTVGSLHGLLEALDPESSYLSPQEYVEWKKESTDRAKGGVGVALSRRGYIFVISSLPNSPALKANLREGDILEAIAGFTTQDMSIQQAQLLLDGPPGSTVKVSIIRGTSPKPQDIELTRTVVPQPGLLTTSIGGDIAYLRVAAFDHGAARQIRSQPMQFEHHGAHKLIPDGYFELGTPTGILSAFLEVDLGNESLKVWEPKGRAYFNLAMSGDGVRMFGQGRFRVAVIANSERRMESVRSAVAPLTEKIFWFASLERIAKETLFCSVWLRPRGSQSQGFMETL